jgi:Mg2+/citrate symporter
MKLTKITIFLIFYFSIMLEKYIFKKILFKIYNFIVGKASYTCGKNKEKIIAIY